MNEKTIIDGIIPVGLGELIVEYVTEGSDEKFQRLVDWAQSTVRVYMQSSTSKKTRHQFGRGLSFAYNGLKATESDTVKNRWHILSNVIITTFKIYYSEIKDSGVTEHARKRYYGRAVNIVRSMMAWDTDISGHDWGFFTLVQDLKTTPTIRGAISESPKLRKALQKLEEEKSEYVIEDYVREFMNLPIMSGSDKIITPEMEKQMSDFTLLMAMYIYPNQFPDEDTGLVKARMVDTLAYIVDVTKLLNTNPSAIYMLACVFNVHNEHALMSFAAARGVDLYKVNPQEAKATLDAGERRLKSLNQVFWKKLSE